MSRLQVNLTPEHSLILRGLAILAVIIIHTVAYLKDIYSSPQALFYVSLDQIGRFCVPMFVLLSGYGLTKKYLKQPLVLPQFLQRRVFKLIPAYLLWSLLTYLIMLLVPSWRSFQPAQSILVQLFLGRVDYQLYFVILIFQLYLFFPVLLVLVKKWPNILLILTFGFQLFLYLWYSSLVKADTLPKWFLVDSNQYVFFGSWIAYFVLGMWLSFKTIPAKVIKILPWLTILAFFMMVGGANMAIKMGVDPLPALRSTRWPVLLFATTFSLTLLSFRTALPSVNPHSLLRRIFAWLGKKSFLLFLAHTLALRIIFAAYREQLPLHTLAWVAGLWLLVVVISDRYLLKE